MPMEAYVSPVVLAMSGEKHRKVIMKEKEMLKSPRTMSAQQAYASSPLGKLTRHRAKLLRKEMTPGVAAEIERTDKDILFIKTKQKMDA